MIPGVDYSARPWAGAPSVAALKAEGIKFVVRYLADDWRGIDAAEFRRMRDSDIDVAAVYEGWGDRRQFSGAAQGVVDATYAQNKLLRTGMPADQPIYFATDWDAQPYDMPFIAAYLRGCAEVIGLARVGVYGGYSVLAAMQAAGVATYYWQTSAWEYGRGLHPSAHLYQHTYNYWIDSVNCDLTDAHIQHFGQASLYDGSLEPAPAVEQPEPRFPAPKLPDWYARADKRDHPSSATWEGDRWYPQRALVEALKDTRYHVTPDTRAPESAPPIATGKKVGVDWIFEDHDTERTWGVNDSGYFLLSGFTPELVLPRRRKKKAA